jgi:hypothetical protein
VRSSADGDLLADPEIAQSDEDVVPRIELKHRPLHRDPSKAPPAGKASQAGLYHGAVVGSILKISISYSKT